VILPEIERCVGSFFPPFQGLTFLLLGGCPKSTQRDELLQGTGGMLYD